MQAQRDGSPAEATGTVVEELPNQLFRVRLEGGALVGAAVTGRSGKDFLRLLPGERVRVRLSERDATRARILGRVER